MSHVRPVDEHGADHAADQPTPVSPEMAGLEHQVEAQREELAATVHALSHKLDLKTQAGIKAERLADRATTPQGRPRPELVAAAGGGLVVVALLWWRRHR